ncbi:MAG: hypothetical protein ACKODS_08925, partial [Methylophilaceae bacterium]
SKRLSRQMPGDRKRDDVQRDFLKYTGQQILKLLEKEKLSMLQELQVNANDRKHQVWACNSLGIPLWTPQVFEQKLEYIHNNPVKAGLCEYPEEYKYCSAKFYDKNEKDWVFFNVLSRLALQNGHVCWCNNRKRHGRKTEGER